MQFGSRFFRQIKGTAMGTPMAVSFANLFMKKFECDLLDAFEKEHNMRPFLWLRFIDDVFFIWDGDESSLKVFFFLLLYMKTHLKCWNWVSSGGEAVSC
jgi:hypothetical protein